MEERIIKKRKQSEDIKTKEQIKSEEKRRTARLKEENEISITIVSGVKDPPKGTIQYRYTKDISSLGANIQGNYLLPVDTVVQIDLKLKNLNQIVKVLGKVKWNRVLVEGKFYEAGVEFIDTSGEAIKKLDDYISSVQKFTTLNPVGVPYWIFAKFNKDKSR
jgi:hypothetical protein